MCFDPVTLSLIAAGVSAAATAGQGFQAAATGRAQARVARQEGRQALQAANVEANKIRYAGERELGTITALQSTAGIDLSSGSALDVIGESAQNVELDALTALYGGRLRRHQKEIEARMANYAGKQALYGSLISAGTTLLTAGAKSGAFSPGPPTPQPFSRAVTASYLPKVG